MSVPNKYNARATRGDDGQRYASVLERDVARVLDLLVRQGRIARYERQVALELAPHRGRERSVRYVADFALHLPAPCGSALLEAKGYLTEGGRLKLRWVREKWPAIRLFVVRSAQEVIAVVEELEHSTVGREDVHGSAQSAGEHQRRQSVAAEHTERVMDDLERERARDEQEEAHGDDDDEGDG